MFGTETLSRLSEDAGAPQEDQDGAYLLVEVDAMECKWGLVCKPPSLGCWSDEARCHGCCVRYG